MKRIINILLALVMMFSLCMNVSVATAAEGRSVTLTGIVMSKEEFRDTYATSEKVSINKSDFAKCHLEMSGFEKMRETLKFDARLFSENGVDISFEMGGGLYSGYKNQISEMKSVIVDAVSSNKLISILLFEMLFDIQDSIVRAQKDSKELRTYSSSFWTSEPSISDSTIRLYLLNDDMVYMFEDDLPAVFKDYNGEYVQMSDPTKDMLWFAPLIPSTVEVRLEGSEEMLAEALAVMNRSSSASETLWTGGRTYYHSFVAYGDTYEQRSMPYGYYRICDVETSTSEWRAEFYICEHTRLNGERIDGLDNLIRYKNVEVSIGSGEYTQISTSLHQGRVKENGSGRYKSFVLNVLSASVDWWDTAVSIYNAISSLTEDVTQKTIELNNGTNYAYTSGTTAVATSVPYGKGEFFNNAYTSEGNFVENVHSDSSEAHYLIFVSNVYSRLDATIQETTETGYIEFKWDVFLNSTLDNVATNVRKTYTKEYINMH